MGERCDESPTANPLRLDGSGLCRDSPARLVSRWLAAGLLILAFFKVRLVILYFMEIRIAPGPIRLVFGAWVIGVCASLIAIYWMGGVPT